jgi:molybdopterin adenylyltransferase
VAAGLRSVYQPTQWPRWASRLGAADERSGPMSAGQQPAPWPAKVLTVSDGVVAGTREDRSGAALCDRLQAAGFDVVDRAVSTDGADAVAAALRALADGFAGLIVTTGGTGFGPRDLTPEGTQRVLERDAPGLAEAMRLVSPLGRLSRAAAGTIGHALVLNTPGSSTGAVECLDAVIDVVPHALDLLSGGRPH